MGKNEIEKTQHPEFAKWIRNYTRRSSFNTVLDLGCGIKWYHPYLQCSKIVSIDAWEKANPDILMDIGKDKLPFPSKCFDLVLMFDVIEHLDKDNGRFALAEAKRVCKDKLLLLTPDIWSDNKENTDNPESPYFGNKYNYHRSQWRVHEFKLDQGWNRIRNVFNDYYYFGVWSR